MTLQSELRMPEVVEARGAALDEVSADRRLKVWSYPGNRNLIEYYDWTTGRIRPIRRTLFRYRFKAISVTHLVVILPVIMIILWLVRLLA